MLAALGILLGLTAVPWMREAGPVTADQAMQGKGGSKALMDGSKAAEIKGNPAERARFIGMANRHKVKSFDRRAEASATGGVPPERQKGLARLGGDTPGVQVDFDPVSGSPSHVQATGRFLTGAAGKSKPSQVVADYVAAHEDLFGHGARSLELSRVTRQDVTAHNGMTTLVWQQQVDGVPVFDSLLKASVTKDGELINVGSHFLSDPEQATGLAGPERVALLKNPPIDIAHAIALAAANLGDVVVPEQAQAVSTAEGAERRQKFQVPGLSDTQGGLAWLPMTANTARLTWDVTLMSLKQHEMFRVLVDAQTGETLVLRSLTNDISNATFNVFADPSTFKPYDSPTPMSPGLSTPGTTQPSQVSRNLVTLSAIDTTASPNGWIDDGNMETLGNNVDAHGDLDSNNSPDLPRPNGGPTRTFNFPLDLTQAPSTYTNAAITQLFYYCNFMHDKLYGLGFTESAGNFQTNNFGRGGQGNDAVLADAQDGGSILDASHTNNANFSTPSDGGPGRMQMYLFTGPTPARDGDFDGEVVCHEYTHGLSNRLVGGGTGISAFQTRGMGEGWSDFYGLSLLSDAGDNVNGNYAAGGYSSYKLSGELTNYYHGIRRYPYSTDMSKNPLTFKDIDPVLASAHAGIFLSPRYSTSNSNPSEFHAQGEVWCVTLWDARAGLINKQGFATGNQLVLQLVTDGMKLAPANPTFLQARDAIIQADLVDNAGVNSKELWAAFAKRGMGATATAPPNTTTTGVQETFDAPGVLTATPAAAATSQGAPGGPFSVTTFTYTLTNSGAASLNWTAAKTNAWTDVNPASGTLAAGASTSVLWSINSGANALPAGEQTDVLTITDVTNSGVQSRPLYLTVTSTPAAQTISFPTIPPKLISAGPFGLTATASSGLPVTLTVVSGPATITASTVTLTGAAGAVTIKASQPGGIGYLAAADVFRTFVVSAGPQSFTKVVSSSNSSFNYALKADGTFWSWGGFGLFQGTLADSTTTGRTTPTQVGAATNWSDLVAGGTHGLGLRTDGTLWGWGFNNNGQIGDGTTTSRTSPVQVGVLTTWAKIAAGNSTSAAIKTDGTLWAWGSNSNGQLGDGTVVQKTAPQQVGTATNWTSVAVGFSHMLAVNSSGELWAWGADGSSQLGDGTTTQSLVPIHIGSATDWASVVAANNESYALKTSGTLWAWGFNGASDLGDGTTTTRTVPTQIGTDTTWTQIAAGINNGAGRKSDGTLWIWGANAGGELGNGTTNSSSAPIQFGTTNDWTAIALGFNSTVALRNDGSLWAAGEASSGSGVQPRALTLASANTSVWTQLTGTAATFHAVRSDSTLWAWGSGSSGQIGVGSGVDARTLTQVGVATDWKQVSAGGNSSTLGVKTGGTLWAWGNNSQNQLGDGTTTSRMSPVQIGLATDWKQVSAGTAHGMAVTNGGTLWGWGSNSSSQLGDGTTVTKTAPTQIGVLTTWARVSAGGSHSVAIGTDGTLWAWGANFSNQLGDGTTTTRSTPVQIGTATNWVDVAAGSSHSVGLRADGTLWSWGSGSLGQLGSGSLSNRTTPVQVGTDTNWAKINVGPSTTLAIKTDGTLWACGQGTFGQLGDGQTGNVTTLVQIGNDTGWTAAAVGQTSLSAIRNGVGFFTAGASGGPRLMAAGRDSRIIASVLPVLQPQSFNAVAASYGIYQSPVNITTTSGLPPTVQILSGPATVSGNAVTLSGPGTVVLLAWQSGDDTAWNAVPPTLFSFTVDNTLAVSFPTLNSSGITSNGFDASKVVLTSSLGFAPSIGTTLTLVTNTGSGPVTGTFPGIPQGGFMTMAFGGVTYGFQVDYQGGDGNDIVLTQLQAPQTITVAQIHPKETTDAPFGITASVISNLPITYSVVTGPATVSGNLVTLTGAAGSVTLKASQAGNALFSAAPDVLTAFAVGTNVKFVQTATNNSGSHFLAIGPNGWLWGWGSNVSGQLGDGTITSRYQPVRIGTGSNWARIAAGSNCTLAIKTDGTLWAWGSNSSNQLGDGTATTQFSPEQIGAATNWATVSTGSGQTLAVKTDGTLWAWGGNGVGQVGNGTLVNQTTPVQIGSATTWAAVCAGQNHSFGIQTDGSLWAWGLNSSGQLGLGDTTNRSVPTRVGTATNWKAVSGASNHSVAVRTDGTLWAWGGNGTGQLGLGDTTNRSAPTQVGTATDWSVPSAGLNGSYAIKTGGTLWSWGYNAGAQVGDGTVIMRTSPVQVGTAADWALVQGGQVGALAVRTDGTVWIFGDNNGTTGLSSRAIARAMPPSANNQISTSATHTFTTRSDGTMWAFGSGPGGELGNGGLVNSDPVQIGSITTWARVRAGNLFTLGIRSDGTLWAWGANSQNQLGNGNTASQFLPVQIGSATDWNAVAPSPNGSHTLALKTGGTLWAWGLNSNNQLGDGTTNTLTVPTQIGSATDWSKTATGSSHSLAIKTGGTLWAWGLNSSNQLGDGTVTQRSTPTQIGSATNWAQVAAFATSSYALKTDGTLWAWGANAGGQLGDGTFIQRTTPVQIGTDTDWVQVSAGSTHAAAIKADGSLWTWGTNANGQLGDGTATQQLSPTRVGATKGWVAVSCGLFLTTALRDDGSVWTAGNCTSLRLSSSSGRSQYVVAPVVPGLNPQTLNLTPIGTNPYRFTASSGLPVSLSLVSGQGTITGDQINLTGAAGAPAVVLVWQAGDDAAWNAVGPAEVTIGVLTAPSIGSVAQANVTGSGVDLTAMVNPNGGLTTVTFQYGTSATLANFSTTTGQSVGSGNTSITSPVFTLTGLSQATTYYYRAVATSAGGTTTSAIQSFTTLQLDITIEQPAGTPLVNGVTSAYGNVAMGTSSTLTYTIKNNVPGTAITIGTITLTGTDASLFSLNTTGMTTSLSGNTSTTFTVTFTPMLSGARSAIVTIPNNDPDDSPFIINLTATGNPVPGPGQTIVGPATLPARYFGAGAFSLSYVASSGLAPTYAIAGGTGGTLSGSTFSPSAGGGPVTIRISQAGGSGYNAAPDVYRTFNIFVDRFSKLSQGPLANHGLAIKTDGTLWAWGSNVNGELGMGTSGTGTESYSLVKVGVATNWSSVATGNGFSVAIKTDGTMWAWGGNASGQLGQGDTTNRTAPTQVGAVAIWSSAVAGNDFVIAQRSDGTLWAWGGNASGQLGQGDTTNRSSPTQVGVLTTWNGAAAGVAHVIAKQTNGTLWAWGLNSSSQLGLGDTSNRTSPVQVGTLTGWNKLACAANSSFGILAGTIYGWGSNANYILGDGTVTTRSTPTFNNSATTWTSILPGSGHAVALRSDGSLWSWGGTSLNYTGPGGFGNSFTYVVPGRVGTDSDWTAASGAALNTYALKADGTLWSAGAPADGKLAAPPVNPVAIASGGVSGISQGLYHTHFIRTNGTLWAVGNSIGDFGDGTSSVSDPAATQIGTASNWQSISGGQAHSIAIRTDGTLWATGNNSSGQVGDGTTFSRPDFIQIGTATWSRVAAGTTHSVGIRTDGSLWAWGANANGQLGDGTTTNRTSPVQVGTATDWAAVQCGGFFTLAIKTNGTLWGWGMNTNNELGDGTTTGRTSPVQIGTDTDWTAISAGSDHGLALKSSGTLWSWGLNSDGQLANGTTTNLAVPTQIGTATDWVALQAGDVNSIALKSSGTLWACGRNTFCQLNNGNAASSSTFVQLGTHNAWSLLGSGRSTHIVAATADGTLWGVGNNADLQISSAARVGSVLDYAYPPTNAQTVTFPPIYPAAYGTPVTLAATASSGLPVTYALASGPATLTGSQLTVTGPGQVKLLAWQVGSLPAWHPSAVVQGVINAPGSPPGLASTASSGVTFVSAVLDATVYPAGSATTASFQYGTDPALATFTSTSAQNLGSGTAPVPLSSVTLGGLASGVTYYYRVVAANAGGTTNGPIQSFTTLIVDIAVEQPAGTALTSGTSSVNFGSVTLGASAAPLIFTIRSTVVGTTLNLGTLSLSGSGASDFTVGTPGATTVAGGGSTTFTVSFSPTLGGARTATLSILSNDLDESPFLIALTGTGVAVAGPGQTISGPATLAPKFLASGAFTLPFLATSGLALTYEVVGGTAVTAAGGTLTPVSGGPVTVKISQPGGSGYNAAAPVYRTLQIIDNPFVKLAQGSQAMHMLGIKSNGTLWAWGNNGDGECGDGTTANRRSPVLIGTATNWTQVAVGSFSSAAIRADGTLWTWGYGGYAMLGLGDSNSRTIPTQVGTSTNWAQVAMGGTSTVAIKTDGTLWAWGTNTSSQLGDGTTTTRLAPVQIGTATNWAAVSAGTSHVIATRTDGTLWAWGLNSNSQLGDGTATTRTVPTQIGASTLWSKVSAGNSSSFAVRADGTLWAWGSNFNYQLGDGTTTTRTVPTQIGSVTTWQSVSAGAIHAQAVRTDGSLWAWSSTSNGQNGLGSSSVQSTPARVGMDNDWLAVTCFTNATLALKTSGTVLGAGANWFGAMAYPRSFPIPMASGGIRAIGAGSWHSHFIRTDGTLWGVGTNYSDLGDGTTLPRSQPVQIGTATNWQTIAGGTQHSLALRTDGTLWAEGSNGGGQLGDGSLNTRVTFVQIGSASNWSKIAAGAAHSAAIASNGTLWTWGQNSSGQLGLGDTNPRLSPTQLGTATDWASVACGSAHTLAIKTNGTLWAWGNNFSGQLGVGDTGVHTAPVQVGTDTDWVMVAGGSDHTLAAKSNSLWAWGLNSSNQLGDGTSINRTSPVAIAPLTSWSAIYAGSIHSIGVKTNGELWGWGNNTLGDLGSTTEVSDAVPAHGVAGHSWTLLPSGSGSFTVAATADGTLWGFGLNADSQLTSTARMDSNFEYAHPTISAQTLTFPPVTFSAYNTPVALMATASSGLPVSYVVSGPATLNGSQLTVTGPGAVNLLAYQNGERPAWHNAPMVQATIVNPDFTVEQPALTGVPEGGSRSFGNVVVGGSAGLVFTLRNSGSSNLTSLGITFDGANAADFFVTTAPVMPLAMGGSTTFAVQFSPGAGGTRTATMHLSDTGGTGTLLDINLSGFGLLAQTITFGNVAQQSCGTALVLAATTSSPLAVSYAITAGGGIASLAGNSVTFTAPGTVTVQVTQAGDATYGAAVPVSQTFTVVKGDQVITFGGGVPSSASYSSSVSLAATSSRGLTPVVFSVVSGPGSVAGSVLTFGAPGLVTVQASQAGSAAFNPGSAQMGISAFNNPPVAADSSAIGDEDTVITGTATATDAQGTTLTFAKVAGPAHGTVIVNANGSFSYTPVLNYNGSDSFTFKANDGYADSNVATITLTLRPVNDAPVAAAGSASGNEDTVIIGTVTATDVENDPLTFIKVTGPSHGTLTFNANGSYSYTPVLNYNGSDSFTFKANDGHLDSNVATVTITIIPVNDAPVAANGTASGNEDTVITGTATATDVENDPLTFAKVIGPAHGTLTFNANGSYSYTPVLNYNGSDSFTFKANDGQLDSNIATVTITIIPVNDAPVAANGTASGNEDTVITGTAAATDVENDPLTFTKVTGPAHGALTFNSNGAFSYTPVLNYNGSDSFTFKANDGQLDSNIATITITIVPVNDAPVAANGIAIGDEDTIIIGMVTATDVENDPLTFAKVTGPAHGTVIINANGSFSYTPVLNYNGNDSFSFKANDGQLDSNIATISLTIIPVNDAPVAANGSVSGNEDTVISGVAVATDVENDPLTFIKVAGPAHGTLTFNGDGTYSYTPVLNYNGSDSFTFKANDGQLDSNIATIAITIVPVNDAPVAANGTASGDEDMVITGTVMATDVENDPLTFAKVTGPAHGSLIFSANGSYSYTPVLNYNGSDSFTFKANDGQLDSNIATVTIAIVPVNDAPVAANGSASGDEDTVITGTVTATDVENDPLTFAKVAGPAHGTLTFNSNGTFSYTPVLNYNGSDSFTFKANDGQLDSNAATITLTVRPVNDAPVASDGTASGDEDTVITGVAVARDVENDPLTFIKVAGPEHGTLTFNGDGTYSYVPTLNYNGSDMFTFKANDGQLDSNIATITITLAPVNDAPVASDGSASGNEDTLITGTVTATDVENDPLTFIKVAGPAHGTLTFNGDGTFSYMPTLNYNGSDTFTFKANDGRLDSNIATITITLAPVNDPPVAMNAALVTNEDTPLTGTLAATDVDVDPLSFVVVTGPGKGTLSLSETTGAFIYTPNLNINGNDSFTFKANDGMADSNVATVSIGITPVNDAPVVQDHSASGVQGNLVRGVLTGTDVEGDALTFAQVAAPAHGALTLNADGTYAYRPDADFVGTDSFTYKANDGQADSNIATVTVVIITTAPQWTWMDGPSTANVKGVYGTPGAAAAANTPGARQDPATWSDGLGHFWMFGGTGYAATTGPGVLNDLWSYDVAASTWIWLGGGNTINVGGTYGTQGTAAAANIPGARTGAASWMDQSGNLWLFGGNGRDSSTTATGYLNDLWMYSTTSGSWTWVGGSNLKAAAVTLAPTSPEARSGAATWVDSAGRLMLFGGRALPASGTVPRLLNDLWRYDTGTNVWTLLRSGNAGQGIYGVQGTGNATTQPGARADAVSWMDTQGRMWLFGGSGFASTATSGNLNDLWCYDATTNQWTWINGASTISAFGVYGTLGTTDPASHPGARSGATGWTDATGAFWLFGGTGSATGTSGLLNDVWCYQPAANTWNWMKGPSTPGVAGVYGTLGAASSANTPGARQCSLAFSDGNGNLWLFGGINGTNYYSDSWRLTMPPAPVVSPVLAGPTVQGSPPGDGESLQATINANGLPTTGHFRYSTHPDMSGAVDTADQDVGAGITPVQIQASTGSLADETTYYVQTVAVNSFGTGIGQIFSFTTPGTAPAPVASFTSSVSSVSESAGIVSVAVQLSAPSTSAFTIPFTLGGTATATDYTAPALLLNFLPGQTLATVDLKIIDDVVHEADKTVIITLGTPTGGVTLGSTSAYTLTIVDNDFAPQVSTPASVFATVGSSITFSPAATGSGPLTYQWKKNGTAITGATSATYTLASTALTSMGNYTVQVTNPTGTATSAAAELSVIDASNHNWVLAPAATATLTVNASSPGTMTYQWFKDGVPMVDAAMRIIGSTTKTLTIKLVTTADAADYTCTVTCTDSGLTASSGDNMLAVVSLKPAILPVDALTPGVVGGPYSYQILVDSDPLKTPSSFTVIGLPAGLTVNASGLISGRPTAAVTSKAVTISATNSAGTSPLEPCTLTILPLPATVPGTFAASVARQPGVADNLGARVDITPTVAGAFTARLTLKGLIVSTPGILTTTLGTSGASPVITAITGHVLFPRTGKSTLVLDFALDAPPNTLTGTLTDAVSNASAAVTGFRNPWNATTSKATSYKGYYTFGLDIDPGSIGDQSIPQGNGFGSFTVGDDGTLIFAGRTADNVAFTTASFAGPAGQVIVFAPAATNLGSLTGTPVIVPDLINNHLAGTLSWNKGPASATSTDHAYPSGFAPMNLAIMGGKYTAPSAGAVVMGLPNNYLNARLSFFEGGLLPGQAPPVVFSIRNYNSAGTTQSISVPAAGGSANPARVSFVLAATPLGQYGGSLTIANATPALVRTTTHQGMIIRLGNSYQAPGCFLLPQLPQPGQTLTTAPQLSGQVVLESTTP